MLQLNYKTLLMSTGINTLVSVILIAVNNYYLHKNATLNNYIQNNE